MSVDRLLRVNELLRREIGEALYHVMNVDGFDLSAVTITHVETARDLHDARVGVSIRAAPEAQQRMLSLLRGRRGEIQRLINRDLVLKYTPRLAFVLDTAIERGDHVLGVLMRLEQEDAAAGKLPGTEEAATDEPSPAE
jgi:ribosome-binding factor A